MKFTQLKLHLKTQALLPCYAAWGDDLHLIRRAREMLCSLFLDFPEFNISVFEEGASVNEVVQVAQTLPLMSSHRLVIAPLALLKELSDYLKSPELSTVMFLHGQIKPLAANALNVEFIDCNRLDSAMINSFIAAECAKHNCTIEPSAAMLLAERCARYTGRIATELEKLAAYKASNEISIDDVRINVTATLEYRAFELTDAIVKKDAKRASAILNDMLLQSGAGAKVFGLIYSHFRRLMYASLNPNESALCCAFSIKEYAAKSAIAQAKQFSKAKLKHLLDRLHDADEIIKSSACERVVLSGFIHEVMAT